MGTERIKKMLQFASRPARRVRMGHLQDADAQPLLAPDRADKTQHGPLRVQLTSSSSLQKAPLAAKDIEPPAHTDVAWALEPIVLKAPGVLLAPRPLVAAAPLPPAALALRAPSTAIPSNPQLHALYSLPGVRPAAKWHSARLPVAQSTHSASYLVPLEGCGAALRVSPTFVRGSYTKVRVGLDEFGNAWGVMVMHPGIKARHNAKTMERTPVERIQETLHILRRLGSPLSPRQQYADQEGRVYWTVPLMAGDLIDVAQLPRSIDPHTDRTFHLLLFREAARALRPAYLAGIVHADIKPENFFLSADASPSVVLGDVGLAVDTHTLRSGEGRGTPGYFAPEMMFSNGQMITHKADIFSLGMMFAVMMSDDRASGFDIGRASLGKNDSAQMTRRAIQDLELVRAHRYQPHAFAGSLSRNTIVTLYRSLNQLHPELGSLVFDHMLQSNPKDRPHILSVFDQLSRMQPPGSEDDLFGRAALIRVSRALAYRNGEASPTHMLESLRTMPPRPPLLGVVS